MNEQWTREEKKTWNQKILSIAGYVFENLSGETSAKPDTCIELETDENSWTNHAVIHIGTGDIFIRNEREMMAWSTFYWGMRYSMCFLQQKIMGIRTRKRIPKNLRNIFQTGRNSTQKICYGCRL